MSSLLGAVNGNLYQYPAVTGPSLGSKSSPLRPFLVLRNEVISALARAAVGSWQLLSPSISFLVEETERRPVLISEMDPPQVGIWSGNSGYPALAKVLSSFHFSFL